MNELHLKMNAFLIGLTTGMQVHGWLDSMFVSYEKDNSVEFTICFEENGRSLEEENEMAECICDRIRQLFMSNNDVNVLLQKGEDMGVYDFCVIKNKEMM